MKNILSCVKTFLQFFQVLNTFLEFMFITTYSIVSEIRGEMKYFPRIFSFLSQNWSIVQPAGYRWSKESLPPRGEGPWRQRVNQSINQSVYSGKFASKLFDNVWFYDRRADIFIKFCFYQIFQDVKPAQHLPSILVSFPGMRVNAVRVEFDILGILNTNLSFPLRRALG